MLFLNGQSKMPHLYSDEDKGVKDMSRIVKVCYLVVFTTIIFILYFIISRELLIRKWNSIGGRFEFDIFFAILFSFLMLVGWFSEKYRRNRMEPNLVTRVHIYTKRTRVLLYMVAIVLLVLYIVSLFQSVFTASFYISYAYVLVFWNHFNVILVGENQIVIANKLIELDKIENCTIFSKWPDYTINLSYEGKDERLSCNGKNAQQYIVEEVEKRQKQV